MRKKKLPACGTDGEVMWCYCGKCKQKGFDLPKDYEQIVALTSKIRVPKSVFKNKTSAAP